MRELQADEDLYTMKLTLGTTEGKPLEKAAQTTQLADEATGALLASATDKCVHHPTAMMSDELSEPGPRRRQLHGRHAPPSLSRPESRLMDCNGNPQPDEEKRCPSPDSPDSEPATPARCGPYCDGKGRPLLLSFRDAPPYLQFNPFIESGYRGYLSTKMCIESIFWWTNETINIWSHIFGWMLFLGLTLYDMLLLNIHASTIDKVIVGGLLVCFQACMILSSLYHTFSCKSEQVYDCFLTYDLFGISLSLLAIYMSGIYYAFWCHRTWQTFYLTSVGLIFGLAMMLHVPRIGASSNMKLFTFVGWAAYGVVPTFHWTIVMGGMDNPMVQVSLA
ncbi:progestin and adipoQ receptor family member 3 isoform X1 [Frankliniella occidentalis]|uniref:Progestin and adipoQ receptor family member 3 isoform X1 n=2 Tax=Frankliniella occidentalis TaxID=133901 RepID=A0A9C6U2R1_FRAOC|nr:progestin and adipoQ receptor family member 3 isoform X1 [Frankliniella occidentalis]